MGDIEVSVLGPVEATRSGRRVDLGRPQQRVLLAVLAVRAGAVVPVAALVDALWPEGPPASAGKVVQTYVSRLRKALGADAIERRGQGYALRVSAESLDWLRFQELTAAGRFGEALALWRGPALADVAELPGLRVEAERLEELRLRALEARIEADLQAGAAAELVAELRALVGAHPLRERVRGLLMLALYRSGRQAEALAVYQEARRLLVEEVGIEPGAELKELERRVLAQDSALAAPATQPGRKLPAGTVTLFCSDVEGSTRLVRELGSRYAAALAEHRRILRAAFDRHGGVEVDTQGDSFLVAFARASDALEAAAEAQGALASGPLKARIGLHTGEPRVTEEGYVGLDVHRAARICTIAHGGQVLLSRSTAGIIGDEGMPGVALRDLGEHQLKDIERPERIFQLVVEGLPSAFPPLRTLEQQIALTGTVTIVVAEGRRMMRLARELPPKHFGTLLNEYQRLLRAVFEGVGGREVEVAADSAAAAFATAKQAALAAVAVQRAVAAHEWPHGPRPEISVALHSGEAGIGWVGPAVFRAEELCDAVEGGQIVLSQATASLLEDEDLGGLSLRDLGERHARRSGRPVRVYELVIPSVAQTT